METKSPDQISVLASLIRLVNPDYNLILKNMKPQLIRSISDPIGSDVPTRTFWYQTVGTGSCFSGSFKGEFFLSYVAPCWPGGVMLCWISFERNFKSV